MSPAINIHALVFSLKTFAAAMLALYIAFRMGLSSPQWTIITAYVVAQPRAGAVISKGTYRVIGTIAGAAMAVFLVPPLVNAPELLSTAVALWIGLCTFLAAVDRTSRSYMFILAGVSTCVILFPSVDQPGDIFTTAVARVEEITLGIVCSSVIHATVLPNSSAELLMFRLDGAVQDAARWIGNALSETRFETIEEDRRRLAVSINDMYGLLADAGYEDASNARQHQVCRALLAQLERILPLSAAVDDRVMELRRAGPMTPQISAVLEAVRDWVTASAAAGINGHMEADALRQRCSVLEPTATSEMTWRDALVLNLLARLEDLILVYDDCLLLREALTSEPRDEKDAERIRSLLKESGSRFIERDYIGALVIAASTTITLLTACLLWIASGWDGGTNAVMMAGIFSVVYSGTVDPATFLKNKFFGVVVRTGLAIVYVLAIIPAIDGFLLLALALAPTFILSGIAMTMPRYSALAFNMVVGLSNPTIIADRFVPDFAAYLNNSLATLTGIYFAFTVMSLVQSLWLEGATRRLLKAGRIDIARGKYRAIAQWRSRMEHRIALLTMRSTANDATAAAAGAAALRDLRTGLALAELEKLRSRLPPKAQIDTDTILEGTARHYHNLAKGEDDPPSQTLRGRIDDALQTGLLTPDAAVRRAAIFTLVSLRSNLADAVSQHD